MPCSADDLRNICIILLHNKSVATNLNKFHNIVLSKESTKKATQELYDYIKFGS